MSDSIDSENNVNKADDQTVPPTPLAPALSVDSLRVESKPAASPTVPLSTLLACCAAVAVLTGLVVGLLLRSPAPQPLASNAGLPAAPAASPSSSPDLAPSAAATETSENEPLVPEPTSTPQVTASTSPAPVGVTSPAATTSPGVTSTPMAKQTASSPSPATKAVPRAEPSRPSYTAPAATPTPTPSPSPTASPSAEAIKQPAKAAPSTPANSEDNCVVVVVTAVDTTPASCVPWFYIYNNTGSNYDIRSNSVHLRDTRGSLCDITGTQRDGPCTLRSHQGWYWYPAFLLDEGASPSELIVEVDGYGKIVVPAREKMTNLGPLETLSTSMQESIISSLRSERGFHWWGSSNRNPLGL